MAPLSMCADEQECATGLEVYNLHKYVSGTAAATADCVDKGPN